MDKEYELILGILSLIISILLGVREINNLMKIKKNDFMLKSISIKKIGAIMVFFIVGIVGIYRYFV